MFSIDLCLPISTCLSFIVSGPTCRGRSALYLHYSTWSSYYLLIIGKNLHYSTCRIKGGILSKWWCGNKRQLHDSYQLLSRNTEAIFFFTNTLYTMIEHYFILIYLVYVCVVVFESNVFLQPIINNVLKQYLSNFTFIPLIKHAHRKYDILG